MDAEVLVVATVVQDFNVYTTIAHGLNHGLELVIVVRALPCLKAFSAQRKNSHRPVQLSALVCVKQLVDCFITACKSLIYELQLCVDNSQKSLQLIIAGGLCR